MIHSSRKLLKKNKGKKKQKRKPIGAPPGTLEFTGVKKIEQPNITVIRFNADSFESSIEDDNIFQITDQNSIHWYDVRGLHEVPLIENIGSTFQIHPLVLEDILDTHQRPKYEEYDNGIFIIAKALSFDKETLSIKTEQIALYIFQNLIISFQEDESDTFLPVKERLEAGRGRIRKRHADYLAYALLDTIVDNYYLILDAIEEVIDEMEDVIINNPNEDTKGHIHLLKREMLILRKSVTPLREAVNRFSKSEHEWIDASSEVFIRDLYDHIIQIMDTVETYRDTLSGLQDLYISEISFRMNNVMQVLTIISTIFIPLSFLAGLYGMNFKYMPELEWQYGYFILLSIMFSLAIGLLILFKRNKWM